MLEPLRNSFGDLALEHWHIDVQLDAAHEGYTRQQVMLWGPDGAQPAKHGGVRLKSLTQLAKGRSA